MFTVVIRQRKRNGYLKMFCLTRKRNKQLYSCSFFRKPWKLKFTCKSVKIRQQLLWLEMVWGKRVSCFTVTILATGTVTCFKGSWYQQEIEQTNSIISACSAGDWGKILWYFPISFKVVQNCHLKDIKYQDILLYLLKVIHHSSKVCNMMSHK